MAYKDTKKFNGKRYTFLYYRHHKGEANKAAKEERKEGWNIRIVKRRIGSHLYYDLYGRKR